MSLEEEAVYHRWLWAAWCDKQCSLPSDDGALRKLSAGFAGDLSRVRSCFDLKEDRLYNERLLEEWLQAKEISRIKQAAANARYQSKPTVATTDADADVSASTDTVTFTVTSLPSSHSQTQKHIHGECEGTTAPATPLPDFSSRFVAHKTAAVKRPKRTSETEDEDLEAVWAAYPPHRRGGKVEARKAWKKSFANGRPARADLLLAAIEQQSRSGDWLEEDGKYIPLLATWLSKGRWDVQPKPADPALYCQNVIDGHLCLKPAYKPQGDDKRNRGAGLDVSRLL